MITVYPSYDLASGPPNPHPGPTPSAEYHDPTGQAAILLAEIRNRIATYPQRNRNNQKGH